MLTALIIFIITYILIGLRQIPRLHINRPVGALVGAMLMVVFGVMTIDQAFAAIDMHTLLLLLGMMIITVYLRAAGFFELMADRILSLSRTPLQLLIFITLSSGLLSALFVNDTICLVYTPILLEVSAQLGINSMPYLLALATSSNIGSAMTITGNPQNMLIGMSSKIPYLSFLGALFPVTIAGLAVCIVVIWLVYRQDMRADMFPSKPRISVYRVNRPLLLKSLLASAGVFAAFSFGYPYSLAAMIGAVILLLIGGVRTETILEGVDWTLLLFFASLFIVMHGLEVSGLIEIVINGIGNFALYSSPGMISMLSIVSAILSNVVSNVPAVMLLKPLIHTLGDSRSAWLALAMSSTLAGNLTLIGSVANLIVAQQSRRHIAIGFMEYFRVGALITVVTLAIGILILTFEVRVAHGFESDTKDYHRRQMTITVISPFPSVTRSFKVILLCDTDSLRMKGLQGFRTLKAGEAALFVFQKPEAVTFWMGSVAYPIDIIFIDPNKRVARVYTNLKPGSLDLYPSYQKISFVMETAAGSGINVGEQIKIR